MGNVHSAEAPRRLALPSNKLVKPRTGGASAAGLSSLDVYQPSCDDVLLPSSPGLVGDQFNPSSSRLFHAPPASPSVPFPPLEDGVPAQPHALDPSPERRNSMVAEHGKRDSNLRRLFRSKSSSVQTVRRGSPERRNTTTAADAPPMPPLEGQGVAPPSRRNSMLAPADAFYREQSTRDSWNIADSRVSWNYNLTSYEAKRLLNLVRGEPTGVQDDISAAVSENKYSVVSEVTWKSSHPPNQPDSAVNKPISRANSDLSLYTPVRRRSVIQTPGLATRRNTSRGPPVSSNRYSHPPTPNMSRQASCESLNSRVLSMPPLPSRLDVNNEVRGPVTPCEGDYQTIGAFKLGTLRIVNGSVSPGANSPEPDERHRTRKPAVPQTMRQESGYFSPKPALASERARHGGRRDVDLQIRTEAPAPAKDTPSVVVHSAKGLRSPTASAKSPTAKSPALAKSPKALSPSSAKSPMAMSPSLLQVGGSEGGNGTGNKYLAEIEFSPFSIAASSPTSPLQTTSKANAMEDLLFEDDPEYSTLEVLDLRMDPNAKSEPARKNSPTGAAPSPIATKQVSRSDSGFASTSPSSEHPHKPLSKTDSGYCSNVSLRSLRARLPLPEGDISRRSSEGQQLSPDTPYGDTSSTTDQRMADFMAPPSPNRAAPPPPPPKDYVAAARASVSGIRTVSQPLTALDRSQLGAAAGTGGRRNSSGSNARTWDVVPRSPESTNLSPRSTTSDASTSKLSSSSGSQKGGRLQRLLSRRNSGRSRGGPGANGIHVSKRGDGALSNRELQRKLNSHSAQYQVSKGKGLRLKTQVSRDTLKTILSVGSMETRSAEGPPKAEAAVYSAGPNRRHTYAPLTLSGHVVYAPSTLSSEVVSVDPAGSLVNQPASTLPTRALSIPRKPLPIRKDSSHSQTRVDKDELHFSPTTQEISITAPLPGFLSARDNQLSPTPSSPVLSEVQSRRKLGTPPPVSMATRKQGNMRVPPPLRPQSTPPVRAQTLMLPCKASEDDEFRRGSVSPQEALQQLTGAVAECAPAPVSAPLQPLRSLTLEVRSSRSFTRTPEWQVKTDHDTSRRSSMEVRPEEPLRAVEVSPAQRGLMIRRPSSAQPPSQSFAQPQEQPTLRHRASYDDRTRRHTQHFPPPPQQQQQQQQQQWSVKPSLDPRWNRQTYDPYAQQQQRQWQPQYGQQSQQYYQQQQWQQQHQQGQWDEQHYWEQSQQWDKQQHGRYPVPNTARTGHMRNNSLGRSGQTTGPYRILHSYNSPAYRNAPIWG